MTFLKNFYANYRQNEIGKEVAHIVLFLVSVTFSINLFWNLSAILFWSIVWASLAIVFEFMKVQAFMYAKYYFKNSSLRRLGNFVLAIVVFAVYLVMAAISGVGTWGFAKVSIAQQSKVASKTNASSSEYESRLEVIDEELTLLSETMGSANKEKQKMNEYAGSYQTGQSMMTDDILKLSERRESLMRQREEVAKLLREDVAETTIKADDIFTLIGDTPKVDMDGETVKFYMFLAIVVLLEIVLCLTTGEIGGKSSMDSMRQANLSKYITALFDTDANRLNSDKKIVEKTGIAMSDCKKYRKYLTSKEFGGTPLISYGRGYSKSEFTKDELLSIIKTI
jgi:hypothetical protein